jgi:tetratricopeptide (TPR) repeat protein
MVGRLEESEATLEKILTHKDVQDRSKHIQNGSLVFMLIPLAHLALGWTRYDLRNLELAWANFCQAAQQFYNVDTHHLMRADFGRAQVLAAANEFDESLEICKNILDRRSNIFPLDEASKEKNRAIGLLRSFTLQHLARLNNYGGLGYGRFKTTPNQEMEIEWRTKFLMVIIHMATSQFDEAMKTLEEIEVINDFLPTQNQLDKLFLIKAQLLIQFEKADEARQTLQEVEAFGGGNQKDLAIKILKSLETFERNESEGDRRNGSKSWKQTKALDDLQALKKSSNQGLGRIND